MKLKTQSEPARGPERRKIPLYLSWLSLSGTEITLARIVSGRAVRQQDTRLHQR